MDGFIKLRRGLIDHIRAGSLSAEELGIYVHLLFCADFSTGLQRNSAPHIHYSMGQRTTVRQIQRALERLEKLGFIKRFRVVGKKGDYYILINNYEITSGVLTGLRVDRASTTDWNDIGYCGGTDGGTDEGTDGGTDVTLEQAGSDKNSVKKSVKKSKNSEEKKTNLISVHPISSKPTNPVTEDEPLDELEQQMFDWAKNHEFWNKFTPTLSGFRNGAIASVSFRKQFVAAMKKPAKNGHNPAYGSSEDAARIAASVPSALNSRGTKNPALAGGGDLMTPKPCPQCKTITILVGQVCRDCHEAER